MKGIRVIPYTEADEIARNHRLQDEAARVEFSDYTVPGTGAPKCKLCDGLVGKCGHE